jgi:hypothetical protein
VGAATVVVGAAVVVVLVSITVVVAAVATVVPLPSELAQEAVNTRIAAKTLNRLVLSLRNKKHPSRLSNVLLDTQSVVEAKIAGPSG